MALLTNDQVTTCWEDGQCEMFGLYAVKFVSAADTIDMSAKYRSIGASAWVGASLTGSIVGTQSGTTVTAPAGLANAAAYLLMSGIAR